MKFQMVKLSKTVKMKDFLEGQMVAHKTLHALSDRHFHCYALYLSRIHFLSVEKISLSFYQFKDIQVGF